MDESTEGQLRVIRKAIAVMRQPISQRGCSEAGLDARIGRITREHGEVEFCVERMQSNCQILWIGTASQLIRR
jgi:hypothetical protein